MFSQSMFAGALVGLLVGCVALISASNPYAPTYNDAASSYEPQPAYQQQQQYQPAAYKPQPSYHQQQASYEPASYAPAAPAYHAAPAYPKYQAPSSAHHTQYDNYYPKQTYSKPMYAPPKQYSAPAPAYYQPAAPAQYAPAKPAYQQPAPAYGHHEMEEYKKA